MSAKYKIRISNEAYEYFQSNNIPMSYIVNHLLASNQIDNIINLCNVRSSNRASCKQTNITLGPYTNKLYLQLVNDSSVRISTNKFVYISLSRIIENAYALDIINENICGLPLISRPIVMSFLNEFYIKAEEQDIVELKEKLNELYNL